MESHPIKPIFNDKSKILILGSFPSVASRNELFFYGHPRNRFWRVISAVFESDMPGTVDEKRSLLLNSGVALWDVIASCDITGSADSSIRNVAPTDLSVILTTADIKAIFVNGATALRYYNKFQYQKTKREAVLLPSTSPANARYSFDLLVSAWSVIRSV